MEDSFYWDSFLNDRNAIREEQTAGMNESVMVFWSEPKWSISLVKYLKGKFGIKTEKAKGRMQTRIFLLMFVRENSEVSLIVSYLTQVHIF